MNTLENIMMLLAARIRSGEDREKVANDCLSLLGVVAAWNPGDQKADENSGLISDRWLRKYDHLRHYAFPSDNPPLDANTHRILDRIDQATSRILGVTWKGK